MLFRSAGSDLGQLSTGDRRVGAEGAVRIAADDAHVGERGNRVVVPFVERDVGIIVRLRPVLRPHGIAQEAEEDRRDLGAGDVALRMDVAVGVALSLIHILLAAYYSQARGGQNVPVDYTPVKFVKKPAGAKPGMVIYDRYQTGMVTPDEALVERLREESK